MKKILFTLAALAMIMVSCTQDNLEIEAQENRTFTVSAAMPEANDNAQTRVSLTPDAESGSYGLELKWENDDKLMLCFDHDGTYYHNDAPIVASTISTDGKTAQFAITIPTEIPTDATFNLYGVYQKTNTWYATNGGYFKGGTKLYELENSEEECITLDEMGSAGKGIARPMLYFSQANIVNSSEPAIALINLKHSGWMMALHFKNSSGVEINLPSTIQIAYSSSNPVKILNGYHGGEALTFDADTKVFSGGSTNASNTSTIYFSINQFGYDWLPLYGNTLLAGESIVFYRWLVSSSLEIPSFTSTSVYLNGEKKPSTNLSGKTVELGKVYHIGLIWDGTDLTWGF